jgi:hypothetical protein
LDSCFRLQLCFRRGKNSANAKRRRKLGYENKKGCLCLNAPCPPRGGPSSFGRRPRRDLSWRLTLRDQRLSKRLFVCSFQNQQILTHLCRENWEGDNWC